MEKAIEELIGQPFALKVNREPLAVVALVNGYVTPLSELPDGLRSSLAWLGEVLRRLDLIPLPETIDPLMLPMQILLDEIDAHLHPAWQRKILHIAERLLPNAQIIVATHSPFVVQSALDACVLSLDSGSVSVLGTQSAESIDLILGEVFGIQNSEFSIETMARLDELKVERDKALRGEITASEFEQFAQELVTRLGSRTLDGRLRPLIESIRQQTLG